MDTTSPVSPISPISPTSPTSPTGYRRRAEEDLPDIFALVIGINKYASPAYDNLTAAVRDADMFEQYLLNTLNVPSSHIISLRDEQATRAAIISGFMDLRDDVRIIKDYAAIIIYFAGHGTRQEKPQEWEDWETIGPQIEAMCPADLGTKLDSTDEAEEIPSIPDRTISVLLNHLSAVKGNNITLILDCCSSGGLNRAERPRPGFVARQIFNAPPLRPSCDQRILMRESRAAGTAKGFSGKHHASHVLLAACGRDQMAYENPNTGNGMFTASLLETLASFKVDDLTYTALMHRLNMPVWQTPHCEGQYVNRRLFNKRASGADGSYILSKREKMLDLRMRLTLQAGMAQGITVGSVYGVYSSNLISDAKHSNLCLGNLTVTSVDAFTSSLSTSHDTPIEFPKSRTFYSKLIERASEKITIYCDDKPWIETVFPPISGEASSVELVDNPDTAALRITIIDGNLHFDRNSPLITPHIGTRMPHKVPQSHPQTITLVREVVRCAIHFNYHLTRAGDDFKNVWMELRFLQTDYSHDFDQILTPIGNNLLETLPATVVVDEAERLGMSIFNNTDLPLYPYLFYFDPSDFVIIEWYTPPFGAGAGRLTHAVDAPLLPKSHLTIGYGEGGVSPWQFLLRAGEDKDVGFFKLFLTTSPADFSNIAQESPFERGMSRHGGPAPPVLPDAITWGSQLATIIQIRHAE